jgi:hypothetical protein
MPLNWVQGKYHNFLNFSFNPSSSRGVFIKIASKQPPLKIR